MMKGMSGGRLSAVTATVILAALAACTSDHASDAASVAPPPPAMEQLPTVIGEAQIDTEATIQSIDRKSRKVTLRRADGNTEVIEAPADVDLAKVKKGDVVIASAYQRLSVQVMAPGTAPLGVVRQLATAKSQPGEQPGRAGAELTRMVAEVAAIDLVNNTVTLRGADGGLQTLNVKNPDNQRKLKTLKLGDLVQIDLLEVAAIGLKPRT